MKITKPKLGIILPIVILIGLSVTSFILAEQIDISPESNSVSIVKTLYNSLETLSYGDEESGDLGAVLNRIKSAAEWVPNGTITVDKIVSGKQFINGSRTPQVSTSVWGDYSEQTCRYRVPVGVCSCQKIIKITQAGTTARVTDNGVTKILMNNNTFRDPLTGLYWTGFTSSTLDNEFSYVNGDDRVNPTGASCNFNSPGTANQYCDNQDPNNAYTQDNDVSAAEFCLNLELDSDNADGDANGKTGMETDWRLPTLKEMAQASIDCLSKFDVYFGSYSAWVSTSDPDNDSNGYAVQLIHVNNHWKCTKNGGSYCANARVLCVRRSN